MELFKMNAGIDVLHIAYKGAGPAVADLVGGHVHAMFATVPSIIGAARAGKVRVLGVTSTQRFADLPEVPTIAESGMPGFEVISWQGLCTPTGVSDAAFKRLRAALSASLAMPPTQKQLADQGMQIDARDAAQFTGFIKSERAKWAKLVKAVGIDPR
jgi:tripartite-type tricarboxylate transporter receptor subunit TctC